MTEEEACLYLTRVRDAKRDIALLEADYRWACDGIERLKRIQIHGNLSASIANTKRYAKRVTVKRDALLRFREEAAARIERLPDERFRKILKERYLEGDTWWRIETSRSRPSSFAQERRKSCKGYLPIGQRKTDAQTASRSLTAALPRRSSSEIIGDNAVYRVITVFIYKHFYYFR